MIETLVGSLLGGVLRLTPELLGWLDRRGARAYHLALLDRGVDAVAPAPEPPVQAPAGPVWVEVVNRLMRPIITFWWAIVLYTAALVAQYAAILAAGVNQVDAVLKLWGPDERAIVAGIINFWLVDRSLRKP